LLDAPSLQLRLLIKLAVSNPSLRGFWGSG
jgi:hypothetical protein